MTSQQSLTKQSMSERDGRGPETQICWFRSTIPQNPRACQEMSLCDYFISDSVLGSCSHSSEVGLCYSLIRLSQGPVSTVKAEHFLSLCSLWIQQRFWMQILYGRLEMRPFLLTVEQGPEYNKMCMHTASIFIQAFCTPTTSSPGTWEKRQFYLSLYFLPFLARSRCFERSCQIELEKESRGQSRIESRSNTPASVSVRNIF